MKFIAPEKFELAWVDIGDSKIKPAMEGRAVIRIPWFEKDNDSLKRRNGYLLIYSAESGNG